MIFQYGSYVSANCECDVKINRVNSWSETGYNKGWTETWRVTGVVISSGYAALTTRLAALKSALAVQGGDLTIKTDGGVLTTHVLRSADCLGGIKVLDGPSFNTNEGGEYVTYRTWEATFEGTTVSPNSSGNETDTVDYHESIEHSGGLPRRLWQLALNADPVKQVPVAKTTFRMTQNGYAVGKTTYPEPNPPATDELTLVDRSISYDGPQRKSDTAYENYKVSWNYVFEDKEEFTTSGSGTAFPHGGEGETSNAIKPTP